MIALPWSNSSRFIWYQVDGLEREDGRTEADQSFSNPLEASTILTRVESVYERCPNLSFGLPGTYVDGPT